MAPAEDPADRLGGDGELQVVPEKPRTPVGPLPLHLDYRGFHRRVDVPVNNCAADLGGRQARPLQNARHSLERPQADAQHLRHIPFCSAAPQDRCSAFFSCVRQVGFIN